MKKQLFADKVFERTLEYLGQAPKAKRKQFGQFFSSLETAKYMAAMFTLPSKSDISVLDAGAGSGILVAAVLDRLEEAHLFKQIDITCYETDENILPLLEKNLEYIKENSTGIVTYKIIKDNYITSQGNGFNNQTKNQSSGQYDMIICNPPYMKLGKSAPESIAMAKICYGAANLYALFMSMGLFNLSDDGEMVFIVPRSWTSGAYFREFRKYIFTEGCLRHVHLFGSRTKVFKQESVIQETMIIKMDKASTNDSVNITCSKSVNDFNAITPLVVPVSSIIKGPNKLLYLPTNESELETVEMVNNWHDTLLSNGFKMKTGLVVSFRCKEYLHDEENEGTVPLLSLHHIRDGRIVFPFNQENEYISTEKSGIIQENKNYLLIRRLTSKEERRRLQCGIYLQDTFPKHKYISTHNKINFIERIDGEMTIQQTYGLYVIFNSTLYDEYYRILNGSTQVNSSEANMIPLPPLSEIERLGEALLNEKDLSVDVCDKLLESLLHKKYK